MERRRLQKWKRVEELRHQDYLIAGGKMESKRREIASDKIFEYQRDGRMNRKTLLKEQIILTFMTVCWLISRLLETQHYM